MIINIFENYILSMILLNLFIYNIVTKISIKSLRSSKNKNDKNNTIQPIFGIEERQALNSYMEQGGWITEFQKTAELEDMITRYTGAKHCFMVNNGTVSLTYRH